MITMNLDWCEVLWWMQGGMAGSHLRWSVYEDMVDKVWPLCTEQERRNMWLIMRRDLGTYWRPGGWSGFDLANAHGEGEWREDISDKTPWEYFRKVLARFNPENQYAVRLHVDSEESLMMSVAGLGKDCVIDAPTLYVDARGERGKLDIGSHPYITVRAYGWRDAYFVDWSRRCDPDSILNTERLDIPDTGEM